eukprot:1040391-Rhodomonas_salina.1
MVFEVGEVTQHVACHQLDTECNVDHHCMADVLPRFTVGGNSCRHLVVLAWRACSALAGAWQCEAGQSL